VPATAASVRPIIEEALAAGVHFIAGGLHDDGSVLAPVVLGGATPAHRRHRPAGHNLVFDFRRPEAVSKLAIAAVATHERAIERVINVLREDIFAPLLVVVTVVNDDEAVTRANDCPFALGASVFTRDNAAARQLAARLNAGVVSINDIIVPTADAHVPLGGRKRSGFGVTRGAEGLLELTAPKVITVSRSKFRPAFDPPHPGDEAMFQAYLKLAHGSGLGQRARALVALFKSLFGRTKHSSQSTL